MQESRTSNLDPNFYQAAVPQAGRNWYDPFGYPRKHSSIRFWIPYTLFSAVLLFYPVWPSVQFTLQEPEKEIDDVAVLEGLDTFEQSLGALIAEQPSAAPFQAIAESTAPPPPNRFMIDKIGVDSEIIESQDADVALNQGIWRIPFTSTPDQGSNTVISAHRYKFLPPSNKTFYLIDKLVIGDVIRIEWEGKMYFYRVAESSVVTPKQVEILRPTNTAKLTIFSCTPLFTSKNRLVVTADLVAVLD